METITFSKNNFSIKDTLLCGQTFRFYPFKDGFFVISGQNACYAFEDDKNAVIYTDNKPYFENYFDLKKDYSKIVNKAKSYDIDYLKNAAEFGKGIRILNQNAFEMIISFIISQNNNIPRIKKIINTLCKNLGKSCEFMGEKYYSFPECKDFTGLDIEFYKSAGLGYRAGYLFETAPEITHSLIEYLKTLSTIELKKHLLEFKGIGEKVADCVTLFGFSRTDSFPVDVWINKVYTEHFNGKQTNRNKITEYFLNLFKDYSGYIQQYLFYYKRGN